MKPVVSLCMAVFLLAASSLFAQKSLAPVQIFMPESPSVGDTAELRYIFHTDKDLIEGEATHRDLPVDMPVFSAQQEKCTVLSAALDRFGSEYTLSLTLVGWKVGQIDFSAFVLGDYLIDLEPVEFGSVVEKTGAAGFRPPSPPLVVPGTTAVLAVLAVFLVILFGVALFALFHIPAIADFLTKSREERRARRNMRVTLKKLRTLATKHASLDDAHFCAAVQHILRGYLTKRFYRDFAPVGSADLYAIFTELSGGELPEEQENAVQQILYLFNRTDYIRYAHANLNLGEREEILNAAATSVEMQVTE